MAKSFFIENTFQSKFKATPAVAVILDKVSAQYWGTEIPAVGTIQSFAGITVRAQIAGRITAIPLQSGQSVKQGDRLFEINPEVLKAQLNEAQAKLESSQFEFERLQKLFQKGAVSEEKLIQAKSQYHNDEAALVTIEQELALATNIAEFDGILGLTQVELGDEVAIGDPLATLQSTEELRVEFTVPQKYRSNIQLGDEVKITRELMHQVHSGEHLVQTIPSPYQYGAKVYAVDPLVNEDTRTVTLRARFSATDLYPGSYVDTVLQLQDKKKVLTVPETALMASLYGDFVYLVVDQKAKKTAVKIGRRRNGNVEIVSGVQEGDTIIAAGLRKVFDGVSVRASSIDIRSR
ncbi:efflux RND transporter periplasmic adaptor subunit [uncultured Shewanella sp.]|uniref:efflux RND transporter periplasmic adaptor subunit n=1 Tax=uncultured Shewanella sp. TaxID=173975 RepID=UPI002634483E|nr:efflux RND transporter periplasmic adaptor subunit [uncultured Shewanella sp.]